MAKKLSEEYMKRYWENCCRKEREDQAFKEFQEIIERKTEVKPNNVYVIILMHLGKYYHGRMYVQIEKAVDKTIYSEERILKRLNDLKNIFGLVSYEDKRYKLTRKGKKLYEYLFEKLKMLN
jgi:predicted type IV restriction endonuclease